MHQMDSSRQPAQWNPPHASCACRNTVDDISQRGHPPFKAFPLTETVEDEGIILDVPSSARLSAGVEVVQHGASNDPLTNGFHSPLRVVDEEALLLSTTNSNA